MVKAVILGAGIVGLCTAEILSRRDVEVEVVTNASPLQTTSASAVAVLTPFFPGSPELPAYQRSMAWAKETLAMLEALQLREPFLERVQCFEFGLGEFVEDGFHVEKLLTPEFETFGVSIRRYPLLQFKPSIGEYDFSVGFNCRLCNTGVFIPQFVKLLQKRGVQFRELTLKSVGEVDALSGDVFFNCLGSGSIFPDSDSYPVLGQSMFIPSSARTRNVFGIGAGHHAVFSHRKGFYIGSYFLTNETGSVPRADLYEQSIDFVQNAFPLLCERADVECPRIDLTRIAMVKSGIRPFRSTGPRVELSNLNGRTLVHNYGHGAHGWTIGYASAAHAVSLIDL